MRKSAFLLMLLMLIPLVDGSASYLEVYDRGWSGLFILGATNTYFVRLKSLFSGQITDLQGELTVYDLAGSDVTSTASFTGSLFPGQVAELDFSVFIPANAVASHYKANLKLTYLADGVPMEENFPLLITVTGTPRVEASLLGEVRPGWPSQVLLKVKNKGDGVAREVRVSLRPNTPYASISSPVDFGVLEPGEEKSKAITAFVSSADEAVSFTLVVTWRDEFNNAGQDTYVSAVPAVGGPFPDVSVSVNRTELLPGENEVKLIVRNDGSDDALNVTVELGPSSLAVSPSRVKVGRLRSGEERWYLLKVQVSPEARGPVSIPVTVSYEDEGREKHTYTMSFGFYVDVIQGPQLVAFLTKKVVRPASQEVVGIILRNLGDVSARDVKVDVSPSKDLAILTESGAYIPELSPGDTYLLEIMVSTPKNVYGSLPLTLTMNYLDEYDRQREKVITLSLIAEDVDEPVLSALPVNYTLSPDEVNPLLIKVNNEGGDAKDLVLRLVVPQELGAVVSSDFVYLRRLSSGESVTVNYSVYLTPKVYGAIQMALHVKYKDSAGREAEELIPIGVRASGNPEIEVMSVSTSPPSIFPGDYNVVVTVMVTNVGNYVAKKVRLKLQTVEGSIEPSSAGSDEFLLPYLPPGESAPVTFRVDVKDTAKPGRYNLKLNTGYGEAYVPIEVETKAKFRLVALKTVKPARPGDKGVKLLIVIRNEERVTAEDVRVEIVTPYLVGTTSAALGDVPKGLNSSLILEVDVDQNAPLVVPLDIKVSWKQGGRSLSQTIPAKLHLAGASKKSSADLTIPTLLIALALASVAFLLYRRGPRR